MTYLSSVIIGLVKPNRRTLSAIRRICLFGWVWVFLGFSTSLASAMRSVCARRVGAARWAERVGEGIASGRCGRSRWNERLFGAFLWVSNSRAGILKRPFGYSLPRPRLLGWGFASAEASAWLELTSSSDVQVRAGPDPMMSFM